MPGIACAVRFLLKNPGFLLKNPDFLMRNPDFLMRNPDFLLKNLDFIIKQNGACCNTATGQFVSTSRMRYCKFSENRSFKGLFRSI